MSEESDIKLLVLVREHFIFWAENSCLFKKGSILNLLCVVLNESFSFIPSSLATTKMPIVLYLLWWLYPLLPSCCLLRYSSHPLDNKYAFLRLMTMPIVWGGRLHCWGPTSCGICLTVIVSQLGPCVRTALKLATQQQGDALNTAAGRISSISCSSSVVGHVHFYWRNIAVGRKIIAW